jgi:hypothetical protein
LDPNQYQIVLLLCRVDTFLPVCDLLATHRGFGSIASASSFLNAMEKDEATDR